MYILIQIVSFENNKSWYTFRNKHILSIPKSYEKDSNELQ